MTTQQQPDQETTEQTTTSEQPAPEAPEPNTRPERQAAKYRKRLRETESRLAAAESRLAKYEQGEQVEQLSREHKLTAEQTKVIADLEPAAALALAEHFAQANRAALARAFGDGTPVPFNQDTPKPTWAEALKRR